MDAHLYDTAKHDVLAVEVRRRHSGDEELAAVGVGAGIGHAEQPSADVLVLEALVRKLGAVYALATRAVVVGKVTALLKQVSCCQLRRSHDTITTRSQHGAPAA